MYTMKNENYDYMIRFREILEALRQPPVSGECEHPYHSVLGDGEMQPAKCLKCGKVLCEHYR